MPAATIDVVHVVRQVLTGQESGGNRVAKVYRNDAGIFTDSGTADDALTPVHNSSVAWGDYDNDGDLDILLTGYNGTPVAKVYRNDDCVTLPLTITQAGTDVQLSWADLGLSCTYDIYEATSPHVEPTTVTYADQTSGVLLPRIGDVNTNYYYVVKAICNDMQGVSGEVGEFDFAIVPGS